MKTEIILIGPPMAGKSTLGRLTAEALGVPNYSLDDLRWKYMKEIGYDKELDNEILRKGGISGAGALLAVIRGLYCGALFGGTRRWGA